MLKLYDLPISSYGCKIRILLRHKKLQWNAVAPPDGYGSDAYCKIVPVGTIPALSDNGFIIFDSDAIAEYINEKNPTPPMLPESAKARATARSLSRFHDSRLEPVLRAYFGQIAPSSRNKELIYKNNLLLQRRLDQLAQIVTPTPLLIGDDLSIPDCGFAPSFAILNRLKDILGLVIELPDQLQKYENSLFSHPSVTDEIEKYFKVLDRWIKEKLDS